MGKENLESGGKEGENEENVDADFSFEQKWVGKREKEGDENGQLDVERRSGVVSVVFLRILRRGKG